MKSLHSNCSMAEFFQEKPTCVGMNIYARGCAVKITLSGPIDRMPLSISI